MNFASDNTAGIAPEILHALVAGNDGFAWVTATTT